jgi:hypothetical protein
MRALCRAQANSFFERQSPVWLADKLLDARLLLTDEEVFAGRTETRGSNFSEGLGCGFD